MGFKCCVPGCKSGYKRGDRATMFRFPFDGELRRRWLRSIHRDHEITSSTRVCHLHFYETDFVTTSSDTNLSRKSSRQQPLSYKKLKPSAVPRIFPNLPTYLTKPNVQERPTTSSSESRAAAANRRVKEQMLLMEQSDAINKIIDLRYGILYDFFSPIEGFEVIMKDSEEPILFVHIEKKRNIPRISCSLSVDEELKMELSVHGEPLNFTCVSHITKQNKITSFTEINNILAYLKNLISEDESKSTINSKINAARIILSSIDPDHLVRAELLDFIVDQLSLITKKKQAVVYSPSQLIKSFLWHSLSPSLYNHLRSLFILPGSRRLRQISAESLSRHTSFQVDHQYFENRTSGLSLRDKHMVLQIDEIYTAGRIEYSGGQLIGVTGTGTKAKTILAFMIRSLSSKFEDVVLLVPMDKMTALDLHRLFLKVMEEMKKYVFIAGVSTDNLATNRKFFEILGGNELHTFIEHPTAPEEKLFLWFDPTHNFKNLFNIWTRRKILKMPESDEFPTYANFNHVIALQALEDTKRVRVAHSLSRSSLIPNNIQKTSPRYALSVFHESVICGLRFYDNEGWKETANFIEYHLNLWKILNVKSSSKGVRKKDMFSEPVRPNAWQIDFLRSASSYFNQWKTSKLPGLTSQTFTAFSHTTAALADLCDHLLTKGLFSYLLLGYSQSDPIEGRFGRYRQLCGANFYVSVRQVAECEQKIRIVNLMHDNCDLRDFSPKESTRALVPLFLSQALQECDDLFQFENIDNTYLNLLYYIGGYVGRSIYRRGKCDSCKTCLISSEALVSTDSEATSSHTELINIHDRGSLSFPSDLTFSIVCLTFCAFDAVMSNSSSKAQFLALQDHRRVFVTAVEDRCATDQSVSNLVNTSCVCGHSFFKAIVSTVFNCLCKNFCKDANDCPVEKGASSTRKLKKHTL